jgi:hypothetical protein
MIALAEGPNEISFALPGVDAFLLKSSLISRVREMAALAGTRPASLCRFQASYASSTAG